MAPEESTRWLYQVIWIWSILEVLLQAYKQFSASNFIRQILNVCILYIYLHLYIFIYLHPSHYTLAGVRAENSQYYYVSPHIKSISLGLCIWGGGTQRACNSMFMKALFRHSIRGEFSLCIQACHMIGNWKIKLPSHVYMLYIHRMLSSLGYSSPQRGRMEGGRAETPPLTFGLTLIWMPYKLIISCNS